MKKNFAGQEFSRGKKSESERCSNLAQNGKIVIALDLGQSTVKFT
jgi:hypothetical protein